MPEVKIVVGREDLESILENAKSSGQLVRLQIVLLIIEHSNIHKHSPLSTPPDLTWFWQASAGLLDALPGTVHRAL